MAALPDGYIPDGIIWAAACLPLIVWAVKDAINGGLQSLMEGRRNMDMVWCEDYGGYLLDYATIEPYGGEVCRYLMEEDADEYSGVWLYVGDRLVSNNCFAAGALLDDCIDVIRGDAKVVRACDEFYTDIENIAIEYADEI